MSRKSTNKGVCSYPACECMHGPEDCGFKYIQAFATDPHHGGKVTCRKCNCFIPENTGGWAMDTSSGVKVWFCEEHWNRYEHYYGLDKPVD